MLSMVLLSILQAAQPGTEPPAGRGDLLQRMAWAGSEAFHRDHMERIKRGRAMMQANVELFERLIKQGSLGTESEAACHWGKEITYLREAAEMFAKCERELEWYEQQRKVAPGLRTEQEASERLAKLHKEWDAWQKAWDRGLVTPMPRAVKK